ncbi:calcium-binding protein [Flexibacterium corallicola]|uniref:calcium-binding protein n=1 Tax=Flexibacterium corallicola TaxID=3037259 RepID=UPI00286F72B4|nr:hypothetical protein [Pseudovibrio sp. M1P-2-3]
MSTGTYKGNDNDNSEVWKGSHADRNNTINYYVYGYGGNDSFKFTWTKSHDSARFQSLHAYLGTGDDYLQVNLEDKEEYSNSLEMDIDGEQGDDFIEVSNVKDKGGNSHIILRGGSGNDTIYGTKGADTIYGDYETSDSPPIAEVSVKSGKEIPDYTDTPYDPALSYDDVIIAGRGDDLIYAGFGNDVVIGDDGDDTIYGGDGDDYISGGNGSDTIYGEAGNDFINVGDRTGSDIDTVYGGEGADTIISGGMTEQYSLNAPMEFDWQSWGIERGGVGAVQMTELVLSTAGVANPGYAIAIGALGSYATRVLLNSISKQDFKSQVIKDSSDYVRVADFDPREDTFIYAATMSDHNGLGYFKGDVNLSDGSYELWTDVTQQSNGGLLAQLQYDTDLISYIQQSSGSGAANTVIAKDLSYGLIATNFKVTYSNGTYYDSDSNELSNDLLGTVVGIDPDTEGDLTLKESLDDIDMKDGQTILMTGAYGNLLLEGQQIKEAGDLFLAGSNFSDIIYAKNHLASNTVATAFMYGFDGDDLLYGGDQADMIFAGEGNDTMTGNAGADTFVFEANAGFDTISDFTVGEDIIRFYGKDYPDLTYDDLSITQIDDDASHTGFSTIIAYDDNQITLTGVAAAIITQDDFQFS